MTTEPQPVVLEPIFKEKVWGGRRLERFGKSLPPGLNIGESWELADLSTTSASGGGGDAARSCVASGPLKGRTVSSLTEFWGDDLLGGAAPTVGGGFPLLVKYLDAREHLSVQVHPSPEYAASHPGAHLKTECWLVLDAEPGSVIFKGLKAGVTRERLREHIEAGTVPEVLESVPAVVGELHNLPSGTCHALGAGVLVAEVQTPSDTTFRVYDWAREYGRAGRELHVDEALANIQFEPAPGASSLAPGQQRGELVRTPYYIVEQAELLPGQPQLIGQAAAAVVMVLDGDVVIRANGRETSAFCGETALVPASCAQEAEIEAGASGRVLIAHVAAG